MKHYANARTDYNDYHVNTVDEMVAAFVEVMPAVAVYFKDVSEDWQVHVAFAQMMRDGMGHYGAQVYDYEYSRMTFMFVSPDGQYRSFAWEADHNYVWNDEVRIQTTTYKINIWWPVVYGPGY